MKEDKLLNAFWYIHTYCVLNKCDTCRLKDVCDINTQLISTPLISLISKAIVVLQGEKDVSLQ